MLSDWTKVGPSLDFFLATEHQGILALLLERASWAFKFEHQAPARQDYDEQIEWHQLAGRRFQRMRKCLACRQERFHRTLLAVVVEPLRHLHSSFLKFAHSAADDRNYPKLLDEVWPAQSMYVAILQYFSTFLANQCSRLRLLFQISGCRSFEEWCAEEPLQVSATRSQLLLVATVLARRYHTTLYRWPWKLFGIADMRRSSFDHKALTEEFWQTPMCCLPAGFSRQIRTVVGSMDAFIQQLPLWRWLLLMSALTIKGTIAGVERRHATHKRNAHPQMPFCHFTAETFLSLSSILSLARHQMMALERLEKERHARELENHSDQAPETSETSLVRSEAVKKQRLRAPSVWDLWRREWFAKEKQLGNKRWPGDPACWQACKDEFAALSEECLAALSARAEASRSVVEMQPGLYISSVVRE
ncbi:unnamed protein product [Durusdinium trenchii]|uniref:Uncharacterized protein n=1 Tax=Durusdinium trenchii TaxID=1381693 RepID=A0ABP0NZK8_9DINO